MEKRSIAMPDQDAFQRLLTWTAHNQWALSPENCHWQGLVYAMRVLKPLPWPRQGQLLVELEDHLKLDRSRHPLRVTLDWLSSL